MSTLQTELINGLDTDALRQMIAGVANEPASGKAGFEVLTTWRGGVRSDTRVSAWTLGGRRMEKNFSIKTDEPPELLGQGSAPNPQETLMAAFNACMMVGYVAGCSLHGISIEHLSIETDGELDLRGFLGIDASVKPGYDELRYTVRIRGNATHEQFQKIHETVMATSPNRWNIANPIKLKGELVVG
jgi:uncharacterized OsmC-like protein